MIIMPPAIVSPYETTAGSGNAFTATINDPGWKGPVKGQIVTIVPNRLNTDATTLNINGTGALPVRLKNWPCVGGELNTNVPATFVCDGTYYHLLNHGGGFKVYSPTITTNTGSGINVSDVYVSLFAADGPFVDLHLHIAAQITASNVYDIRTSLPIAAVNASQTPAFLFYMGGYVDGLCWLANTTQLANAAAPHAPLINGNTYSWIVTFRYRRA